MSEERLLKRSDLASMLGVCERTVKNYEDQLPVLKLNGGAVRFRPKDVERWLQKQQKKRGGNGKK